MRNFLWCILCWLAALGLARAQDAGPTPGQTREPLPRLEAAQEHYRAGRYGQAAAVYEGLLAEGYREASLFYNLGNAYFRLDSLGPAALAYERALLLDPADADVRYNLELVRDRQPERIEPIPEFFLRRWWRQARDAASPRTWSVWTILALWLGVSGMAVWWRAPTRRQRKWGFLLGVALLLGSLLPFFLAADRQAVLRNSGRAVVLAGEVILRSAPETRSQALKPVYAGTGVELLDAIGDWYKVRLADGEQGWLPIASLEEI